MGLVQGIGGPPAPVVEFLPNASASFIQGVASQVYDVEGIHDCPCVGEFFGSSTLKPGESIHRYDLDVAAPRVGTGDQPGFEDLLGATRDHIQEPRGAATVRLSIEESELALSMGMSRDLEWAIAEGATIVRLGTAIFGARRV